MTVSASDGHSEALAGTGSGQGLGKGR